MHQWLTSSKLKAKDNKRASDRQKQKAHNSETHLEFEIRAPVKQKKPKSIFASIFDDDNTSQSSGDTFNSQKVNEISERMSEVKFETGSGSQSSTKSRRYSERLRGKPAPSYTDGEWDDVRLKKTASMRSGSMNIANEIVDDASSVYTFTGDLSDTMNDAKMLMDGLEIDPNKKERKRPFEIATFHGFKGATSPLKTRSKIKPESTRYPSILSPRSNNSQKEKTVREATQKRKKPLKVPAAKNKSGRATVGSSSKVGKPRSVAPRRNPYSGQVEKQEIETSEKAHELFEDAASRFLNDTGDLENSVIEDEFHLAPEAPHFNPFSKIIAGIKRSVEKSLVRSQKFDEGHNTTASEDEQDVKSPSQNIHKKLGEDEIMAALFSEEKQSNETGFGVFSDIIKEVHSQSSQNISTYSRQDTDERNNQRETLEFNFDSTEDEDDCRTSDGRKEVDFYSSDEEETPDPFQKILKKMSYPYTERACDVISPNSMITSDEDDDNFASMFGFADVKKKTTTHRLVKLGLRSTN